MHGSERADNTVAEVSTKRWASKNEHIKGNSPMKDHPLRMVNGKQSHNDLACTIRRRLDKVKVNSERMRKFLYGPSANRRSENVPSSMSDFGRSDSRMFNSAAVYVMILNSGIGGSLDNTRWRDRMSDWAVETSKEQQSLVTLREGTKMARRKARSDREDSESTPEANCESVMP